jgi:hypothetical protein
VVTAITPAGDGRAGEEHQVGDHLVRAKGLRVDRGQLAPLFRIGLIV